ncbi:MAG: pyroglutamyl-peptidase I [Planctomycetes bacterium]|nr:pyroglutamyl-peptidase I [Planctomycetota bacterium]
MLETILLTGFGPFGRHERNVSEEAVRRLDGAEVEGFALRALCLPVQFERAVAALEEALESERPLAVISLGIHDEAGFRLELSAKNERHYALPDVDGQLVQDAAVEDGAPAMVFSSLPVAAIKQAFEQAGLPVELSEDAGRYLCNAVAYWTARRVSPAGFVHVPAAARLEDVLKAARLAAEVTARRLVAQRVEATTV